MAIKEKRKILYIITKSVWGGAGKYVYDLATNLPCGEFEAVVAAGGRGELAKKIASADLPYHEIKNFQKDVNVFKDFFAIFEIFKLLKKINPDIIHVNSSKAGGIAGIASFLYKLSTASFQLKTIFTAHGWAFHEDRPLWKIFLIKLSSKFTCFFYDKIICVSEFDRQSAIKNKIASNEKITTIHNGIKINDYNFLPRQKAREQLGNGVSKLDIWIGTIGEFTKNKGQEYLIDAVYKLNLPTDEAGTKNNKLKTIITGWGGNELNLKHQISNLKLENEVFLINNLSPATPYLKAFDIFVLPSLKEGLPYTILEAGLAELPVIASNTGGIPEIIENGKSGFLIRPKNSDELASVLEKLINNELLRKDLATALRAKILEEFTFEKMLNSTLAAYEENPRAGN
ncbi:MAG: glycosyltransferase family 4 protein [bacterium]|nr:glycosyltransferase family 4 protein [bacterium]